MVDRCFCGCLFHVCSKTLSHRLLDLHDFKRPEGFVLLTVESSLWPYLNKARTKRPREHLCICSRDSRV